MPKNVLIIGGGISGLALLHYLKKKYASRRDVEIRLIEKSDYLGGTIRTLKEGPFSFETGPNGFLSSKPSTLELIKELGIEESLVRADAQSKCRYIFCKNTLHEIKASLVNYLMFKPFSFFDKIRVPCELFIPKGNNPSETIYDFGVRRLGRNFTELFLDAMVTGIYGGDVRELNLKATFPRIYEIEQTYGSLFKGMIHLGLSKKRQPREKRFNMEPKGNLMSLKSGMGELIETLALRYKDDIALGEKAEALTRANNRFIVQTNQKEYSCDSVFVCTPAYSAAEILFHLSKALTENLRKIFYAPMAVLGLVYKRTAFLKPPMGFGYLIPGREQKEVLGCIFSSNVFPGRADKEHMLFQVMIGGARHPYAAGLPRETLTGMAKTEIAETLCANEDPVRTFSCVWPKAIPQYNREYPSLIENIQKELANFKGLFLAANYLGGVSLNDCIENAKLTLDRVNL